MFVVKSTLEERYVKGRHFRGEVRYRGGTLEERYVTGETL